MPQGICKLCLQTKDLQDSHLIPAAMYRYMRALSQKNPNPVVAGRKVTATTSRQITERLLCAECEDLLNKNGEREVLKWVWNGKRFPLGERLAVAHPHYTFRDFQAFSGTAIGIDTEKLAYFALSMVWRTAIHQWNTPFGGKTTVLNLGTVEEPIRRYLRGEARLPSDIAIIATACIDPGSLKSFYIPSRVSGVPGISFAMLTLGIHLMVSIGSNLPPRMRELCCARSAARLIFMRDCERETLEVFSQIFKTSKMARTLE